MFVEIIDSHIHLDVYEESDRQYLLKTTEEHQVAGLITVSQNLQSSQINLALADEHALVHPAFGFHPEQPLPSDDELQELIDFIEKHEDKMVAVGEVGLPYYLRQEQPNLQMDGYLKLLETFILLAKKLDKPVILHAVYEDAPLACRLLEKHDISKAHFHWFKGDEKTLERMKNNGYYISVTPDIVYESEIQEMVKAYPLESLMVETDGPWPFEGPFQNQLTHPKMIHESMMTIARLKETDLHDTYKIILENTKGFYGI